MDEYLDGNDYHAVVIALSINDRLSAKQAKELHHAEESRMHRRVFKTKRKAKGKKNMLF